MWLKCKVVTTPNADIVLGFFVARIVRCDFLEFEKEKRDYMMQQ
jgi:hypothetical protein